MSEHDRNTVSEEPDLLTDEELDAVAGGFNPHPGASARSGIPPGSGARDGGFEFDHDPDMSQIGLRPGIVPRP